MNEGVKRVPSSKTSGKPMTTNNEQGLDSQRVNNAKNSTGLKKLSVESHENVTRDSIRNMKRDGAAESVTGLTNQKAGNK
ncbi:hypothetical protein DPMN_076902 [Dreissena polymorpha]|uniref:Uncharacterized protein n=1 Tax=Dreissena polymorpha TaxID=45954 RepID=A0A9D3YNY2_DREPO|nr:hypothetical protein DPMN_076902 [Dreissena polymorpha]